MMSFAMRPAECRPCHVEYLHPAVYSHPVVYSYLAAYSHPAACSHPAVSLYPVGCLPGWVAGIWVLEAVSVESPISNSVLILVVGLVQDPVRKGSFPSRYLPRMP